MNSTNKRVEGFDYKTNPNLSCISSNEKGQYAIGSDTGEIRMFSHLSKRAKVVQNSLCFYSVKSNCIFYQTLLPGLGHAIIGIDTTADGKWLLATTSKYLMLVPVELEDGRTGFDVSMGNKNKPVPFKLQILPQDLVKYGIAHFVFSKTMASSPNPI